MIYISRYETGNAWANGAWAEVLKAFSAQDYSGEPVDHRVLVQPSNGVNVQGQVSLLDFNHPGGDTLYLFGPDDGHLNEAPSHDVSVFIPQLASSMTLWSHQAAAVVLWDRVSKHEPDS